MTVGERIKKCRLEKGISADELAKQLGKNRATIYRYEKGEIENLPVSVIEPIANALDTSPSYIMGWSSEGTPPTKKEAVLLEAYRAQPEMQAAVDRILGISSLYRLKGQAAARGFSKTRLKESTDISPEKMKLSLIRGTKELDF